MLIFKLKTNLGGKPTESPFSDVFVKSSFNTYGSARLISIRGFLVAGTTYNMNKQDLVVSKL